MNPDTHLYLYAKGHYKKTDKTNDIRRIVARRANMRFQDISKESALIVLRNVTSKEIKRSFTYEGMPWAISDLASRIEKDGIIEACLHFLACAIVTDLELGEPDPNILELSPSIIENENRKQHYTWREEWGE